MSMSVPSHFGARLPRPTPRPASGNGHKNAPYICFLSREFQPLGAGGGIGTYVWNMARGLNQLGCTVEVLTAAPGTTAQWVAPGVRARPVRPVSLPRAIRAVPGGLRDTLWRLAYSFGAARTLEALTREEQVVLVEAPEWGAEALAYAMRGRGVPVVVRLHTPQWLVDRLNHHIPALGGRLAAWMERQALLRADAVSSPSASLADIALTVQGILPPLVDILPNPVDTETFYSAENEPSDERLLYVGRLERRKGVDLLARALPLLRRTHPGVRCVFIGGDTPTGPRGTSYRAHLLRLLRALGCLDIVEFHEGLPPEILAQYYQASAVCVIPSVYEAFGYTCFEAMACARPVVCASTGGLAEWVHHKETGVLMESREPEELAAVVAALLENPTLRRAMGKRARQWVQQEASLAPVAQRTLAFYGSVVDGRGPSGAARP